MTLPNCPKCDANYTYEEGHLLICPMCFHEWTIESQKAEEDALLTKDANGNVLADGDDVITIKDLKLGNDNLKQGMKAKGIKILDIPMNDHDLTGKVDKFGTIYLKSSVVKKA